LLEGAQGRTRIVLEWRSLRLGLVREEANNQTSQTNKQTNKKKNKTKNKTKKVTQVKQDGK